MVPENWKLFGVIFCLMPGTDLGKVINERIKEYHEKVDAVEIHTKRTKTGWGQEKRRNLMLPRAEC